MAMRPSLPANPGGSESMLPVEKTVVDAAGFPVKGVRGAPLRDDVAPGDLTRECYTTGASE